MVVTPVASSFQVAPPSCVPMMVPSLPAAQPSRWLTQTSAESFALVGLACRLKARPSGLDQSAPDLVVSQELPVSTAAAGAGAGASARPVPVPVPPAIGVATGCEPPQRDEHEREEQGEH